MSDYHLEPAVQETDRQSTDSDAECSRSACSDRTTGSNPAEPPPPAAALAPAPTAAEPSRPPASPPAGDPLPGEFVMRDLFADFTVLAERKIELVMAERDKHLSKSLQRGEDERFDQLLTAFGSVAEHCLPSLLRALFAWYERQMAEAANTEQKRSDTKQKSIINIVAGNATEPPERSESDLQKEKRDLAVEFVFCLALIEVLKQMSLHPGHEDLVRYVEKLALGHFKRHDAVRGDPNAADVHMVSDLYAEVIGALAQSRFASVRTRFMAELKELRSREPSAHATQSIVSLLMGMKFFRVKMVPIEEFEASFQFMQECAQYFLEVKDKDIKHALAGLFVEILVPVAAAVKNEVNVPCLKNFVEMLYSQTLDASTKSKHRLALFPLVTCLLCVSQKQFFLQNWHYFLAMCLSHLKNRDPKMCRVALESLYRLLWVYMIRIKCESNSATQSRLQSIVNSLFPKGSKGVVPRDTPLNIFVKIIQFVAQERLDFAMREIVFDLLSVARPFKLILTPERMSIGLRAFLVVADSLQQKEGDPPMPRSVGVLPSGNTLRVRKTFLNKMLTEDTAKSIGMNAYFPHVRRVFVDILRALDAQYGRPLMMINTQNVNKEPDEMITGERKPRIELFRTCVAAVPRLIPDGMTSQELVDLLSRLTVHMDEELRGLSYCSLQSLVVEFPDWRRDVVWGLTQFLAKDVLDTFPQLMDHGLKMVYTLLGAWRMAVGGGSAGNGGGGGGGAGSGNGSGMRIAKEYGDLKTGSPDPNLAKRAAAADPTKSEPLSSVLHSVEALALVMLCNYRPATRRLSILILKEVKSLLKVLGCSEDPAAIDVMDARCERVIERCLPSLPQHERAALQAASSVDLQWLADRSSTNRAAGACEEGAEKGAGSGGGGGCVDLWSACFFGFLERDGVLGACPTVTMHSWPVVFARLGALYSVVDPSPINDNRASLLRSATAGKKPPTERETYMHLWKNYATFAFRVVPLISNPIVRCASPDLSLSSSPDSLGLDRPDGRPSAAAAAAPNVSPAALYKLVVPHLRSEVIDVRDAAVYAIGNVNCSALRDLLDELAAYAREAVDRKQENVRRRRRKDALRLQLVKSLELMATNGTFGNAAACVVDKDGGGLNGVVVEFVEGVRFYLENEPDKSLGGAKELTEHFGRFLRRLIKNFTLETCKGLLKRDLRRNLFALFANWAGEGASKSPLDAELRLTSLQAMSSLLCCGPCFDQLTEESVHYAWLDGLLNSRDEKVYALARETVVLLLESNADVSPLLDWVVDRCYTAASPVADSCFLALAAIFGSREYPCDQYAAVINVALMNAGRPRQEVRDAALGLLQLLDARFFGGRRAGLLGPENEAAEADGHRGTLDSILAANYCRSQVHLSRQLALLHPELTMPMFSEITYRFQTARPEVRQLLLQYLLPWLHNMELVDPNVPSTNVSTHIYQFYQNDVSAERKEGWGSAEATEMVLNNIFYVSAKFGDSHPKEIEDVWSTLCTSWPNNMKVIIRYLIIVSGMAPLELLPCAKRVVLYLARVQPARLLDEMMVELQTVETLNCLIERTETPPFYRLTVMRKASSHSDGGGGNVGQSDSSSRNDLSIEKGTIHTKRHSGEDPSKNKSDFNEYVQRAEKQRNLEDSMNSSEENSNADEISSRDGGGCASGGGNQFVSQPHPLPMPEFGGYFAPLTEYLPESSQPISGFHRCNVGVMLLCDVVVDGGGGAPDLDWSVHVPLMLHVVFLGLDHSRPLVHEHCKQLLLNLLVVLAKHEDHLTVAHVLLNSRTDRLGLGLATPTLGVVSHVFTESDPTFDEFLLNRSSVPNQSDNPTLGVESANKVHLQSIPSSDEEAIAPQNRPQQPPTPLIIIPQPSTRQQPTKTELTVSAVTKSLIQFLSTRQNAPLWNYEDITAKVWSLKSSEQMDLLLQHVLKIFVESLPNARISERWAQTALQLGLGCSSRHYAGRSLQIYRALRAPITSRMLSDVLSRLVETVAEQGEDMQGYVTELLLTLESSVENLESDFRPLDLAKDLFKSTPNLINFNKDKDKSGRIKDERNETDGKDRVGSSSFGQIGSGHARSTSYSVCYGFRKGNSNHQSSLLANHSNQHNQNSILLQSASSEVKSSALVKNSDVESRNPKFSNCNNLSRSRSAQSLKLLGDSANQDDKLTILAQLFWLAVSLLESDYEHEFLLAVRLLSCVMNRLPLDRPDARDKVEKLQNQLRWSNFPGVHALLLKGCTNPNVYEVVVAQLAQLTPLLDFSVVDPSSSVAFPMNVIALLPYLLVNYEDANQLCVRAAENIAQVSIEKSKKLENLGTVMNLYSRRTFSKESFQWTKCVVKYLHDTYSHLSLNMLSFLMDLLEKGPVNLQPAVLNIVHCVLHYVDLSSAAAKPVNADLLRVIVRYVEGSNWKEALKILKLVVSRSSSLVAPPAAIGQNYEGSSATIHPHPSFSEDAGFARKELPGRTMEFTFDMSQTPVIGRRFLHGRPASEHAAAAPASSSSACASARTGTHSDQTTVAGQNQKENQAGGWRRPCACQGRVRECLVNLLTTCGQRVGLPKSPSVIFSQTSDLIERQSSFASSTEEVSAGGGAAGGGAGGVGGAAGGVAGVSGVGAGGGGDEASDAAAADFGVFKDFDFLEYESESIEGESADNFNWGVRRRPLSRTDERRDGGGSEGGGAGGKSAGGAGAGGGGCEGGAAGAEEDEDEEERMPEPAERRKVLLHVCPFDHHRLLAEESSDDDIGSESPLDESANAPDFDRGAIYHPPSSLALREAIDSSARSDTSASSAGDAGEATPCNASPSLVGSEGAGEGLRALPKSDALEGWTLFIRGNMAQTAANSLQFFHRFQKLVADVCASTVDLTRESCSFMSRSSIGNLPTIKLIGSRLASVIDAANARVAPADLIWFDAAAVNDARFFESLRYGMLEVQEHLETFCDRKEQAVMHCDAVRTTLKLESLSAKRPGDDSFRHEGYLLDLAKAVYKLLFQLLLLVEAGNKAAAQLLACLRAAELTDATAEAVAVRSALSRACEDADADGGIGPALGGAAAVGGDDPAGDLCRLIENQKWTSAALYFKCNRDEFVSGAGGGGAGGSCDAGCGDVGAMMEVYCAKVVRDRPDCFIMTNQECDLADVFGRLFQVSAAVSDLEGVLKEQPARSRQRLQVQQAK